MKTIKKKIEVAKSIYLLITSICKNNKNNEEYTYKLKDNFLFHAQYIKEATDCIISIVGNNESILTDISKRLASERELNQRSSMTKYSDKAIHGIDEVAGLK
jgi:inositol 1,4,5-triphosphate receptor type 1/inositol 1,4,5-triphosphate receptor type 3